MSKPSSAKSNESVKQVGKSIIFQREFDEGAKVWNQSYLEIYRYAGRIGISPPSDKLDGLVDTLILINLEKCLRQNQLEL